MVRDSCGGGGGSVAACTGGSCSACACECSFLAVALNLEKGERGERGEVGLRGERSKESLAIFDESASVSGCGVDFLAMMGPLFRYEGYGYGSGGSPGLLGLLE